MTAAVVIALGLIGRNSSLRSVAGAGALTAFVTVAPAAIPVLSLGAIAIALRHRMRSRANLQTATRRSLAEAVELTALGLTGGLGAPAALSLAGRTVGGTVGREIEAVLRRSRIDGLSGAVADGHIGCIVRVIGRANATGAPLLDSVSRLADELNADLAAQRLAAVRRIPVAMLFPLTLLILPGFLLLAVAPALFDAFGRLEI
ncbi:MAG: type II secretion system F family protein [Acidimicrobiia bacterium]|nr:type II secretion system F family protein [Acidimicrobiia bacterium]